ncbi:MAG: Dethiobiotin synthetase [Myxococcaceae bacterium]|nr:Dethiobiotin synthetase [Myxococcaceae bacterium]
MTAPLLVVTGTGTGIGKTHAAAALVLAWARLLREAGVERPEVAGLKPVETGVVDGAATDAAILEQVSTFHVKRFPPPYMLARAVSPHLAAADEGRVIELQLILDFVAGVRAVTDAVVVELPGGLFSPLGRGLDNADVARDLAPDGLLLVVPDRLGVLHDVAATTRAARAAGVAVAGIVVVAPEHADASTGTNAVELSLVCDVPVVAELPRADIATLSARADVAAILSELVRKRSSSPRRP